MCLEYARQVMETEAQAILQVRERLDEHFVQVIALIQHSSRYVITCGMGKAGIVARKIAATLSSTGTPAFYLHPAEAVHGDLGMVGAGDVALVLSNSGESDEVVRLMPCLRRLGATVVAITGSDRSTLAAHADEVLTLGLLSEACPLGLAPSATTTAMLALGDAISLTVMKQRAFQERDYATLHPAGALGRRLLPVEDVMRRGDAVARVTLGMTVKDVMLAITHARSGAAVVVDADDNHVIGIFCDGDLRRGLETGVDFLNAAIDNIMVTNCTVVPCGTLAGHVLELMREKRIAEIPVVNGDGVLMGVADLKGLVASI